MKKKCLNINELPLILIVIYLIVTLLLYAFGPFKWITYNPITFWTLQILYIIALIIGWQFGLKKETTSDKWSIESEKKLLSKLHIFLSINLVFEIVNLFRKFYFSSFDLIGLINKIIYGLLNMGESYNSFQGGIDVITGNQVLGGYFVTVFNYIWELVAFAIVLIATFYFKSLTIKNKLLLITTYFIICISYLSTGTNIGVFRLVLAIVVFFVIKLIKDKKSLNIDAWKKRKIITLFSIALALILSVIFFDHIMQSRGGILNWESESYNIGGIGINKDSIMFKIVPPSMYMILVSASSYLTQGYYGMSLCLTEKWIPTFGIGNSTAILDLTSKYFTDYFSNSTYQYRIGIDYGWDPNIRWHSLYTWFANDITFIGVIFIMFVIGFLFAMAYQDSLRTNNPFSHIMVYFFSLLAFFIPCNNQLFQSFYVMFSFITVLFLWLYTRGTIKLNIKWRIKIHGRKTK